VKGCSPATIAVVSSHTLTTNQTVHFTFGGTAIHGTDYAAPDSATLLAGSDSIVISLSGIATPPSGIKTLTVYLSSPYTCGITDSININLLDSPFVGILTPDTTICSGNSFQIRATASPFLAYTWSPASSLSSATILQPIASPVATTTYTLTSSIPGSGCPAITKNITVTVINTSISVPVPTATICTGGSTPLSVTGSPTLNYSWSPSTGLSNPNIQNPTASPTVTTTYTVTATGPGGICPSSATVTVIVGSLAISVLTPDTTICLGSGFDIRATGTSGATYSWAPSIGLSSPSILNPTATPTATTTYSLIATWPGSGCPDYNYSFTVSVLDARIAMLSADTSFCIGGYDNIQVEGQSGLQYSWTPATGLDNPFIQNPVATPSVTTLYTVTATTPGGLCSNSATIRIAVANPDVAIDFSDSTICLGSSLAMPVKGSKELTYMWTPALGLTNPNIADPIASPATTTVYTLSVSDPGSLCTVTMKVKIEVIDAVLTNVSLDQTIKYGSSVQLNADNAKFYFWTPDDGSLNNANINNPFATPTTPTTYIINGIDKYGCRATDSVRIDLTYDDVFIPDAFSPNNDGLNDVFRVGNLGYYKLVNMNVYNRWGALIYHSGDGNNKGWDGTFEGTKQDLGVYNYYIILMNPKGEQKTFKGNVTLIR
jgi:gliding motility-associated-like protein